MARTVRNAKLDTRSARVSLPRRRSPYWVPISRGFAMGYRKGAKGGMWLAKAVRPDNRAETTLGAADDAVDADGRRVLTYAQAQELARNWLASLDATAPDERPASYTVNRCLDDYLTEYKRRGGKALDRLEKTVMAFIGPSLGRYRLTELRPTTVRAWHANLASTAPRLRTSRLATEQNAREIDPYDQEAVRRRRATANRILTVLKAALNFAFHEGRCTDDSAWRAVRPFREANAAKVRYLSLVEAQRLVNACTPEFRPLVQCALLSGCRYGEIIAFCVDDFDRDAGTISVRLSKSGRPRHVILTDDGIELFIQHVAGKRGNDLVFTRLNGSAWGRSHQSRPLKEACRPAGIDPPASFHILRHTYATHLLRGGATLPVIAANLGHADTRMTERHYAHLVPSHVADVIRSTMPRLGLVEPATKIVPLVPSAAKA